MEGGILKIAYIMPHSYEYFYPQERKKFKTCSKFDEKILCKRDGYEHKICKVTKDMGIDISLYYLSSTAKKKAEFTHKYGHKIKRMPLTLKMKGYGKYGWEFSYKLLRELSLNDFDLIFIFTYSLNCFLPLDFYDILAIFSKKNNYPLITHHGGGSAECYLKGHKNHFKSWIKKRTLNLADKITVETKAEFKVLNNNLGIDKNKIIFLNNPVNFKTFHEIPKVVAAKKLCKDPSKKYIVYIGRLDKKKGIQHILKILPYITKIYPDVFFLIVGQGPFEKELKKIVYTKKLGKHVSFEGWVFHDSLNLYYNLADIFVLPSYTEGYPNVLQEAVTCNKVCIGTDVGGIPDILSDGVGLLVPPKNEVELFKSVKKVLNGNFNINQDKRRKLINEWSFREYKKKLEYMIKEII